MISLPVDLARAPPLNNIFLFNKATFFYINETLCRKWKIEQNKIFKGSLNAVSIFSTLYPKLISGYPVPTVKSESIVVFFSVLEKKNPTMKKKTQIQLLQLVTISRRMEMLFFSKWYIADGLSFNGT